MTFPPDASVRPTVVYITSRGHSGSTLLSLILGGHSQIVSGGELKMLINAKDENKLCSCHFVTPDQCPFWSQVQRHVIDSVGVPFDELALMEDGDDETFSLHNQALFTAIADVSGCSIVVDSSKSLMRLSRLLRAQENGCFINVRPIHLHRGPLGFANSCRRKGQTLFAAAERHSREFFRTREFLSGKSHLFVSYEKFARQTRPSLCRLMGWIGLSIDESQLQWRQGIRRDIGGNRMRIGGSSLIQIDQSWKHDLTIAEIIKLTFFTLPIRLRSKWLYRGYRKCRIKFGL